MVMLVKFRSRDRTASKIGYYKKHMDSLSSSYQKTRIYVEIDFIFGKVV